MFANKCHPTIGPVEQIISALPVVNEGTFISLLQKFCIYEETYNLQRRTLQYCSFELLNSNYLGQQGGNFRKLELFHPGNIEISFFIL